jgi:hypothetical protein
VTFLRCLTLISTLYNVVKSRGHENLLREERS